MKKLSYLLLSVMLLLSSCAQDVLDTSTGKEKLKEVPVHFSVTTKPMTQIILGKENKGVITRSTVPSTIDDTKITDLWVVQFDNSGNFMKKEYCTRITASTFDAPLAANYTGTTSNIYFLANIGPTLDTPDNETLFKSLTAIFTTEPELFITDAITGKKSIPMFGKLSGVTVSPAGYIENFSVTITHMLAKVTLTYDIPSGTNFGLDGIQLRNVPAGLRYNPPASSTTVTNYTVRDLPIEPTTASSGTLVYYLPENQRGVGTNTDVAQNERLKDGTGNNDVKSGTYVEFSGHVTGAKGGDKMTYRYYFGADDFNDYNLVRNQEYSITTSIDGNSASDRRVTIPERANCYMVMNGNTAEIPVIRANESDLGCQLPDTRTGWTASLYWSTPTAGIVTVDNSTASKGYFKVTAHATNVGNALVVIKDGSGNILWSWHIWVDDEDMNTSAKQDTYNGMTWMNRNLGATYGPTGGHGYDITGGFFYQWGRKEPFLGSSTTGSNAEGANVAPFALFNGAGTTFVRPTYSLPFTTTAVTGDPNCSYAYANKSSSGLTNQLKYAVQNPMLFISDWKGSTAKDLSNTNSGYDSWGGEFNQPKSVYDPCPAGWRVPSGKRTSTSYSTPWNTTYTNTWGTSIGNGIYGSYSGLSGYPLTGWRTDSGGIQCGFYVMQWSATANGSGAWRNYAYYASTVVNDGGGRQYGNTVRCVKNWFNQ